MKWGQGCFSNHYHFREGNEGQSIKVTILFVPVYFNILGFETLKTTLIFCHIRLENGFDQGFQFHHHHHHHHFISSDNFTLAGTK